MPIDANTGNEPQRGFYKHQKPRRVTDLTQKNNGNFKTPFSLKETF